MKKHMKWIVGYGILLIAALCIGYFGYLFIVEPIMISIYADTAGCEICESKFLHRKDQDLYIVEMESYLAYGLSLYEDEAGEATVLFENVRMQDRRYHAEKSYSVVDFYPVTVDAFWIDSDVEEITPNFCEECLIKMGYQEIEQRIPKYIIISFRTGEIEPILELEQSYQKAMGNHMISYSLEKDKVRIVFS